jgi:biopolymer transport protein ExbD
MARHEHFDNASEGVNLDIMITPMLDMAFQILSFFIIFYNPALETHFSGRILPPNEVARTGKPKPKDIDKPEPPPADEEPKPKDVIRVIVESVAAGRVEGGRSEGEPKRILLKKPEIPDAEVIGDTTISFEAGLKKLTSELTALKKRAGDTKLLLNLEADGHLRYQYFIAVQNVCKEAKFDNLGFPRPTQ